MYSDNKIENVSYNPETGGFICEKSGKFLGVRNKLGYVMVSKNRQNGLAHRLAFSYMGFEIGEKQVDHINHDRSDNRWENLRLVTPLENNRNKARVGKQISSTGYTGVVLDPKRPPHQRYRAQTMVNKKGVFCGRYPTAYEAHLAVVETRTRLGFHPNHGKSL